MAPTPTILTRSNAAKHFPKWFTATAESINAVKILCNLFHTEYPATVVTAAIPFRAATVNAPEIPFQPAVLNNNAFWENRLKWTTLSNAICRILQSRVNDNLGDHFVVDLSDPKTPYQRFQALQMEVSQGQAAMVDNGVELMTRMKQRYHKMPLEYSLRIKELKWNPAEDGTPQAPCTSLDMQQMYLQEEHACCLSTSGPHGKVSISRESHRGTAHAAVPSIDSNRKVFAFCLPYGLDEATFKRALDHFGPQAETTERAAKAIGCKNLAFPRAGKPDVIVGFVKAEIRRRDGTANVGTRAAVAEFVFLPINSAASLYSLDPSITTSTVTVNLDSAATGSLGYNPVFAQITQNPTIYRGIDGRYIIGSRMEGTISGTTHMTGTIYTTPPIEHIPDAKHNLLSIHDILAKQQMSILFDHTNMTSNIGHFLENEMRSSVKRLNLIPVPQTMNLGNCPKCLEKYTR
ncbi:hypothetical protein HDU80_002642, partial [Chytriomyces hyalinus]